MDIMKLSLLKKIKEMADMVVSPAGAAEPPLEQEPHEGVETKEMENKEPLSEENMEKETDMAPKKNKWPE
jgi:hypothetical protein